MSEKISILIKATTMEGLGAKDPRVTVGIRDITQTGDLIAQAVITNFDTSAQVTIDKPFPPVNLFIETTFTRFDSGVNGVFVSPLALPQPEVDLTVSRLPDQWFPEFTAFALLASPRFGPFKEVARASTDVDLKKGPAVGALATNYDTLSGQPQILAKTALLNLFAVLSDETDPITKTSTSSGTPWFNYVRKIVRMDQERFVAEVDPVLYEDVDTILKNLDAVFAAQGYFTEASTILHGENIPVRYGAPTHPLITIKKDFEQGNLQLTTGIYSPNGQPVALLDCDLDEHKNIVEHGFDILKHIFNGGTNPIDMHEYIVEDSAQHSSGGISTIDLGYTLA